MTAGPTLAVVRVMSKLMKRLPIPTPVKSAAAIDALTAETVSIAVRTPVLHAVTTGEDAEGALYVIPLRFLIPLISTMVPQSVIRAPRSTLPFIPSTIIIPPFREALP